jgi:hypothetical protein
MSPFLSLARGLENFLQRWRIVAQLSQLLRRKLGPGQREAVVDTAGYLARDRCYSGLQ